MSESKKIEIRTSNPLIGLSLETAIKFAQEGVPFIPVPVFTPEQLQAAHDLAEQHMGLRSDQQNQQQQH